MRLPRGVGMWPAFWLLGANIDEVQHQRAFSPASVEQVQIEVVVHTRGVEHIAEILAAMRAAGSMLRKLENAARWPDAFT